MCAGIADYIGLDKTVVRILWAILTVFTALIGGILAYVIFWLLMPPEPRSAAPQAVS